MFAQFLGIYNFYRSGKFYIMTADTKVEMHRNMVVKVMSKKLNITSDEFKEFLTENLLTKHGVEQKHVEELVETLILGKKLVKDGEYAISNNIIPPELK